MIPRSPQPAARSPQQITASEEIMREIFERWDDEARWLRAGLRRLLPQPSEADIEDAIIAMAEKMLDKPPAFQSLIHARRWMRLTSRNLLRDTRRYGKKFRDLDDASKIQSVEDWLIEFEDEDIEHAALAMLDEESAELLRLHISGLSITEIAELKGMHRTTLQMRFKHIHAFLKENLK